METPLAFDNDIVASSPLFPSCGNFLRTVARKDYKKDFFRPDIRCLDMDHYETLSAINDCREKKHTVDVVMGVKTFHKNKFSRPKLLLVELRMDYQSPNNLSKHTLVSKVEHSLDLLDSDEPIYQKKFFIFNDRVIQQMISWFKNIQHEGGIATNFLPLSVTEFNNLIKSEKEFPYIPITDIDGMEKSLVAWLNPWKASNFFKEVEYWSRKALSLSYQQNEYLYIMSSIKKIWSMFKDLNFELSEEDQITAEIIEEDYLSN